MTDMNLRSMTPNGYIFIGIKADDTEKNCAIHEAFRQMASVEFPDTHDNYTLTLGKLLEYYETDGKIESLWQAIAEINARLDELETKTRVPKQKDSGLF